jgi:ATP-dependent DNA helicase RecQ
MITGPTPTEDAASGVRVRELLDGLGIRSGQQFDGTVLLVDDTIRSRWTVTVAARLLAGAGASQVLPFAVHLLP